MRAKSLRNINVSETVYGGAGENGELFSRPDIDEEFIDEIKIIINCDEDKKESLYLILLLSILICYGFNFLFSLFALYQTDYTRVSKICPESLLWYYLLSSTIVLNFVYYICFKGFTLIDNDHITKYLYIVLFTGSSLFGGVGYYIINDNCVVINFRDTKLWRMSSFNNYVHLTISLLSITTPLYLFCKNKKMKQEKKTEKRLHNTESPEKENIMVEIIEN